MEHISQEDKIILKNLITRYLELSVTSGSSEVRIESSTIATTLMKLLNNETEREEARFRN